MTQNASLFLFYFTDKNKNNIYPVVQYFTVHTPYYTFLTVIYTSCDGCYTLYILESGIKSEQCYGNTYSNVQDAEFVLSSLQIYKRHFIEGQEL
jgi:hypothetical protein